MLPRLPESAAGEWEREPRTHYGAEVMSRRDRPFSIPLSQSS